MICLNPGVRPRSASNGWLTTTFPAFERVKGKLAWLGGRFCAAAGAAPPHPQSVRTARPASQPRGPDPRPEEDDRRPIRLSEYHAGRERRPAAPICIRLARQIAQLPMKISVVIAAYDEAANIEPLTRRLAASLPTLPECAW